MGIFSKVFGSYSTRELARIEPLKKKGSGAGRGVSGTF